MSDPIITEKTVTVHARLLSYTEDIGGYTVYVFENLDTKEWYTQYIMCTRFPNWNDIWPQIGDTGYLEIMYISAGDKYYDRNSDIYEKYRFSNIQYSRFVKEKPKVSTKIKL